jgi:alpha-L-rhamnosidase
MTNNSLLVTGADSVAWRAGFAWDGGSFGPGLTTAYFRRRFKITTPADSFLINVTADSRYVLYLNGRPIGRGPLKGDLEHYNYETYDLAGVLKPGENVLAAEIRWFGVDTPTSEVHGPIPGFLLQGPEDAEIDTPFGWTICRATCVEPDRTSYIGNAAGFLGHMEILHVAKHPIGWNLPEYDDSSWETARLSEDASSLLLWGVTRRRHLVPRDIGALSEESRPFVRTIQDHREVGGSLSDGSLRIGAGESAEMTLDAGELTTGYPVITWGGGEGRTLEIVYAECMFEHRDGEWQKTIRDDFENGDAHGYQDTVHLDGRGFTFQPFHWRTFWFIKIRVSSGPTPVILHRPSYLYTTFPAPLAAEYESSDQHASRMFTMSWRTLRLCSHETFEDCPYYEQLHYLGDARLEALTHLAMSGDTSYVKRSIRLYRDSLRADGLVRSRVPSEEPQILPYFSLLWILMVDDFNMWVGSSEADFISSCVIAVEGVLGYFEARVKDDGFVGRVDPWNMVDRVETWKRGEPPALVDGESTYLTCLFVYAMNTATALYHRIARPELALRWETLSAAMQAKIRVGAWSQQEGLYLEGPGREAEHLSQHSQIMAILSGTATTEQIERISTRIVDDDALYRTQLMQGYYLARALEKIGMYDRFADSVLDRWHTMLDLRLSTWAEYLPGRSDCHAWSAWPAHDFLTRILGIRPAKPGFQEILIRPHAAGHTWARGLMQTLVGKVEVHWTKGDDGTMSLRATSPTGVPTTVVVPGEEPRFFESGGIIEV